VSDILVVALTLVFFAVAALLVRWCDRIIGPDSESDELDGSESDAGEVEASGGDELVGTAS
jgi:hypothetical protein